MRCADFRLLHWVKGSTPCAHRAGDSLLFSPLSPSHARPYTGITAPDVTRQSSEHKYAIVLAISAGFTQFSCFAFGIATRFASVSIVLGAIALTITPSSSTSCASDAVKVAIAPFATA